MSDTAVIAITGALAAVACAIPGCFLVLRGMSLLGDAISHAVLPGIVLAFLVTGSVSALPVVLGAGLVGLVTVFLIETVHKTRRVKEDASIAVVFPALFAIGVLLIARTTGGQKDLDQDCVLYGEIAFAPLQTVAVGGVDLSRPALVLAALAVANLGFVLLLWKELKLATFDAALATTLGLSPVLVHYLLMAMVSFTTVASFESVGAILVVAFLIVPPAAAFLLTDRLAVMVPLACAVGALSAWAGALIARALDASIAGCMAAAMGASFLLAWLAAPREGIVARAVRGRRVRATFAATLVLERLARDPAPLHRLAHDLAWPEAKAAKVLAALAAQGLIEGTGAGYSPTRNGIEFAKEALQ